jgi:hypothetical protein
VRDIFETRFTVARMAAKYVQAFETLVGQPSSLPRILSPQVQSDQGEVLNGKSMPLKQRAKGRNNGGGRPFTPTERAQGLSRVDG